MRAVDRWRWETSARVHHHVRSFAHIRIRVYRHRLKGPRGHIVTVDLPRSSREKPAALPDRPPRWYRKLAWKRDGFLTPRAYNENKRIADALLTPTNPITYRQYAQNNTFLLANSAFNSIATINEARLLLGLPKIPGADVTPSEYAFGLRSP